jgi:methyl-accepting chemotaxis protein
LKVTIGKKLTFSFLLVILLLVLASGMSYFTIQKVDRSYTDLVNRRAQVLSGAQDINALALQQMSSLRDFLLTRDAQALTKLQTANAQLSEQVDATLQLANQPDTVTKLNQLNGLNKGFQNSSQQVLAEVKGDTPPDKVLRTANGALQIGRSMQSLADDITQSQHELMTQGIQENNTLVQKFETLTWILCAVGVLLAAVTAVVMTRMISRPVKRMARQADLIAHGDLTHEEIRVKNRDEIGDLAASFNEMTRNLRTLIREVLVSTEQVATTAEELTANAEQTSSAAQMIAATITEVASGTDHQVHSIDEGTHAIADMSSGIQHISTRASEAALTAQTTAEHAMQGNTVVAGSVQQMQAIQGAMHNLAQTIHELGAQSQEIGTIIQAIQVFANQTNLLALNAAIEASRAGDHGRGFAVVADEVRKLAAQAEGSSQEIADLVQSVQAKTANAIQIMGVSAREVERGIDSVTNAGDAFTSIYKSIQEVTANFEEVSSSTQQLAAGAEQIVGSIELVAGIAETTAASTQNVSAASEEQLASIEEIATSAHQLSKMAQNLQDLVSKFKVEAQS